MSDEIVNVTNLTASGGEEACYVYDNKSLSLMDIISVTVEAILTLVVCFGNGLVFWLLWKNETLRTNTYFYIVQLAIADFSMGACLPFHITIYFRREILYSASVCVLRYATMMLSGSASITAMLGLSYDRYLAIVSPLRYNAMMTKRRYVISTLMIWVPPLVLSFILPMAWHVRWSRDCPEDCDFVLVLSPDYFRYIMIPSFPIFCCVMVFMYANIIKVARRHVQDISNLQKNVGANPNEDRVSQLRMLRTCIVVFSVFFLSWAPFFVVLSVQIYGNMANNVNLQTARVVCVFIAVSSSFINPVVYALKLQAFRTEVRKLIYRTNSF